MGRVYPRRTLRSHPHGPNLTGLLTPILPLRWRQTPLPRKGASKGATMPTSRCPTLLPTPQEVLEFTSLSRGAAPPQGGGPQHHLCTVSHSPRNPPAPRSRLARGAAPLPGASTWPQAGGWSQGSLAPGPPSPTPVSRGPPARSTRPGSAGRSHGASWQ